MPETDGSQFSKLVRGRFPGPAHRVVTGYADTGVIESAVSADALILRKPFRASELHAVPGSADSATRR